MFNGETAGRVPIEDVRRDTVELQRIAERSRSLLARIETLLRTAERELGLRFFDHEPRERMDAASTNTNRPRLQDIKK